MNARTDAPGRPSFPQCPRAWRRKGSRREGVFTRLLLRASVSEPSHVRRDAAHVSTTRAPHPPPD